MFISASKETYLLLNLRNPIRCSHFVWFGNGFIVAAMDFKERPKPVWQNNFFVSRCTRNRINFCLFCACFCSQKSFQIDEWTQRIPSSKKWRYFVKETPKHKKMCYKYGIHIHSYVHIFCVYWAVFHGVCSVLPTCTQLVLKTNDYIQQLSHYERIVGCLQLNHLLVLLFYVWTLNEKHKRIDTIRPQYKRSS